MKTDVNGRPAIGQTSCKLGARVPQDIAPDPNGFVQPGMGGMSVSSHPRLLPEFLRPAAFSGGRGELPVFEYTGRWPETLRLREKRPGSGQFLVEPARRCRLEEYQAALAATLGDWTEVTF